MQHKPLVFVDMLRICKSIFYCCDELKKLCETLALATPYRLLASREVAVAQQDIVQPGRHTELVRVQLPAGQRLQPHLTVRLGRRTLVSSRGG